MIANKMQGQSKVAELNVRLNLIFFDYCQFRQFFIFRLYVKIYFSTGYVFEKNLLFKILLFCLIYICVLTA
jgi:hypothetical protein